MRRIVCASLLALPFLLSAATTKYVRVPDRVPPPDDPQVRTVPLAKANTIVNGGFEVNGGPNSTTFAGWNVAQLGSGSWFASNGTVSPLSGYTVNAPPAGYAALSDQTGPGSNYLYQDIVIPPGGATLSFDLLVANRNAEFLTPATLDYTAGPNQQFRVDLTETTANLDVLTVGAGYLGNLYQTTVGSPLITGYSRITRQIGNSSGAPRSVRLRFAEIDNVTYFQIGLDNVSLDSGAAVASSVSVGVNPSRITTSGSVVLSWTPVNATGCVPSGGAAGTVFPTPANNQVVVQVAVGANVRNDVFRVTCNGSSGPVSNSTVLSVGVPPPPPPAPVATISSAPGGAAANGVSRKLALSDGGRFVAFESGASNLVAGDSNGVTDVFVRNTATGAIQRASVANGGGQSTLVSGDAKITRDGRSVLFTQGTGVLSAAGGGKGFANGQVCLNSLATNIVDCFTKSPTGVPGNGASNNGAPSGDGGKVVFESLATNIVPGDGNGATSDVFLFDKGTNSTQILSTTSSGAAATAGSFAPAISCDGRNYAFESLASLLNTSPTQAGVRNIYAITASGGKRLVTVGAGNTAANGDSTRARIADGGRLVFFESRASNLVAGDTNGVKDVFVADLAANTIRRISASATGTQANGESRNPSIPCDGAWATFESDASNLVANDGNGRADVFIVNLGTGTVALASQSSGSATNGTSGNGEMSPDGTAVGFESDASNLGANGQTNVFAGANPFALQNYTGAWFDPQQAGHGLFLDQLADGRLVAWWFTFDPSGNQAWFGGVGQIQGTQAVVSVVRTQGARFLPNFAPADAVNTPIGTLTFNFTGCGSGRVDFALDATFGNGSMNLTRLTTPVGVSCGSASGASGIKAMGAGFAPGDFPIAKTVETTRGPIAGITGAWYDPAQPGHGLFMENIGDGRVLVWWFTFGPSGGQAWFGNIATITSGTSATMTFLKTQGGRWIPNFNPSNVTNPELGAGTLIFSSCDAGVLNYNFTQGFGAGQMILRPLLRPAGTACSN